MGLPFADQSDEAAIIDGAVVYDNNNGSTTTPLILEDGSVQILTTITDSSAPREYSYAPGDALVLTGEGGVDVLDSDGVVVSHVSAPWAIDANGNAVATRYTVNGNILTQHIDLGPSTAYPVVADPKLTWTWWNRTVDFTRSETFMVSLGTGFASGVLGTWFPGVPAKVVATILLVNASLFAVYYNNGKCGKLVNYAYASPPIPQQYSGSEAGGYCK